VLDALEAPLDRREQQVDVKRLLLLRQMEARRVGLLVVGTASVPVVRARPTWGRHRL